MADRLESLRVRPAVAVDLPRIVEIYNASIPSRLATADTSPVTVDQRRSWFDRHTPDRRPLLVGEADGAICGWISLESFYGRPAYQHTAEVSIYIALEAQRRGIGRRLLQEVLALAPALDVRTIVGYIFAHNQPSIRLFTGFGFERWALLPDIAEMDGKEFSLAIYGLRLQSPTA